MRLILLPMMLLLATVLGKVVTLDDMGLVSGTYDVSALSNREAFEAGIAKLEDGDTVVVPKDSTYMLIGPVLFEGINQFTFKVEGTIKAVFDTVNWLGDGHEYRPLFQILNCTDIVVTGDGIIDGQGTPWWDGFIWGRITHLHLPKLFQIKFVSNLLVENIHLLNSPRWTLDLLDVAHAEVRYVTVDVTRFKNRPTIGGAEFPFLEPMDLNTDGIDIKGRDVWVHDCYIHNDDDSVAVKPCHQNCKLSDCTEDILIENMVMTGFGASIGSVPPSEHHNCVRNVVMRNISMPQTGKGIYIKSNPTCRPGATGIIENILYEDIRILQPRWWAIWIGPQQQQEPGDKLGLKCALQYPFFNSKCPTQGCVEFRNITLKDVVIDHPWLSPGVIMGNSTIPMKDIVFDNVNMIGDTGKVPFHSNYQCSDADVTFKNSFPVAKCGSQA